MSRRRTLKTLGGGAALALSGCVGTRWWEDEDDTSSELSGQSETDTTDANEQDTDPGDNSNESGQEDATDDSGESKSRDRNNEESQQKPTEEETDINRDQYDQQEVSDTKARSVDDIEIDADSQIINDGSATVTGTVTNISETSIEVVDLEVVFYDTDDEYLSAQLVTITDLGAGESEQFEAGIAPDGARGQPKRVEINPDVYDRTD